MKVIQAVGPFAQGQEIIFPEEPSGTQQYKWVKIGVQVPQPPLVTEVDDITDMIQVGISYSSSGYKDFYINGNEILEFDNIEKNLLKVKANKALDRYVIIEKAYITPDEE